MKCDLLFSSVYTHISDVTFDLDSVSSSTSDVTPREQETQVQDVPSDSSELPIREGSTSASIPTEPIAAEPVATSEINPKIEELPAVDQNVPDKDNNTRDDFISADTSVTAQEVVDDNIEMGASSKETDHSAETSGNEQVLLVLGVLLGCFLVLQKPLFVFIVFWVHVSIQSFVWHREETAVLLILD